MILCDTGPMLCLIDRTQQQHRAYTNAVVLLEKPLVTTWACFAEAMHLAMKMGGRHLQRRLAGLIQIELLTIGDIHRSDYARLFDLMEKYQDQPMDLADASLVVTAEKLKATQILTLDSDFWVYRINDCEAFDVIQVERLG